MKNENTDLIDRKEAAKILSVSHSTVERLRRKGKLSFIKLSERCIRYRRTDCATLLDACTVKTELASNVRP